MPAAKRELALARDEGVIPEGLASPAAFRGDGRLSAIECGRMESTKPDYPGGRNNSAPSGERFPLDADLAILAVGFSSKPVEGVAADGLGRVVAGSPLPHYGCRTSVSLIVRSVLQLSGS